MALYPPIQFKRSFVSGVVPTDSDIVVGEIAVNLADGIIFSKDDSDNIIEIGKIKLDKVTHDYQAADSDLIVYVTSNLVNDHDSDIAKVIHDYLAADSDNLITTRQLIANVISEHDSDGLITVANHDSDLLSVRHAFAAADSDLRASIDSDLSNLASALSELTDVDVVTNPPKQGETIVWDSDSEKWKPGLTSTVADLNDLTDVNVTGVVNGQILTWDSDSEMWKPKFQGGIAKLNDLEDVNINAPQNGELLAWDSDSAKWVPSTQVTSTYASSQVVDLIVATDDQREFVLSGVPNGDYLVTRNGITLPIDAFVDSDNVLTYDPIYNNNSLIDSDDDIQIVYTVTRTYHPEIDSDWVISQIAAGIVVNGTDSDWTLRQIENNRTDSEWILKQIQTYGTDSEWVLNQIPDVKVDSDFVVAEVANLRNDHDSDLSNLSTTSLNDVDSAKPEHNEVLAWDSDSNRYKPTTMNALFSGSTIGTVASHYYYAIGSAQTYTPDSDVKYVKITITGGGGGGGAATASSTSQSKTAAGGGGGAACTIFKTLSYAEIGGSLIINVASGGNSGNNGGSSTVTDGNGNTYIANGGYAGTTMTALNATGVAIQNFASGGGGGTAGGSGDFGINGGPGEDGSAHEYEMYNGSTFPVTAWASSGRGGSSFWGQGGKTIKASTPYNSSSDGDDPLAYGAGGSGGARAATSGTSQGGGGREGIVIIEEYK